MKPEEAAFVRRGVMALALLAVKTRSGRPDQLINELAAH